MDIEFTPKNIAASSGNRKLIMDSSKKLYEAAVELIPGGVCRPVEAVKPYPFYVRSGHGSHITDIDGNEFVDYCMAYGPLMLGHAHPAVVQAIADQAARGSIFGAPGELEVQYARRLLSYYKSMDTLRFVGNGTDATMSAIRAARGFTGRNHIVKIEGGFHGSHDAVLVKAGSVEVSTGMSVSLGVPVEVAKNTLVVPFNDVDALEAVLASNDDIACLIMEPILGNLGPIPPNPKYLQEVRKVTHEHDVLLIFDEVITGLRVGFSGAQGYYGIRPDLTTLGKIVGGGLPIGVLGGRREIMAQLAPVGKVYQSGTYNGNPLSLAAGWATLDIMEQTGAHAKADAATVELGRAIEDIARDAGVNCSVVHISSMIQVFFGEEPHNYIEVLKCDINKFRIFWRAMLENGVFLPPSQFQACFLSWAHSPEDIQKTEEACKMAMATLSRSP